MKIHCIDGKSDFLEILLIENISSGAKVLEISWNVILPFQEIILDKQKTIQLRDELTRLIKQMEDAK